MAREPKVTAAKALPSPPAAEIAADTAAAIAANYSDGVPVDNLKPQTVVPVAVSIDKLLEVIGDDPERAAQTGVRIVGPQQGRRRAGRSFGPEAQVIPAILLGEDELRAIDGDPLLSWSVVQIEVPEVETEVEQGG